MQEAGVQPSWQRRDWDHQGEGRVTVCGLLTAIPLATTQPLSAVPRQPTLSAPPPVPPQLQGPAAGPAASQRQHHVSVAVEDVAAAMRAAWGSQVLSVGRAAGAHVQVHPSAATRAPAAPYTQHDAPRPIQAQLVVSDDGMSADMRALEDVLSGSTPQSVGPEPPSSLPLSLPLPLPLSLSGSLRSKAGASGGPRARMTPLKRSSSTGSGAPATSATGAALAVTSVQLAPWKVETSQLVHVLAHSQSAAGAPLAIGSRVVSAGGGGSGSGAGAGARHGAGAGAGSGGRPAPRPPPTHDFDFIVISDSDNDSGSDSGKDAKPVAVAADADAGAAASPDESDYSDWGLAEVPALNPVRSLLPPAPLDVAGGVPWASTMPPEDRERFRPWSARELTAFCNALVRHGKQFHLVARDLRDRSTSECVACYYSVFKLRVPDYRRRFLPKDPEEEEGEEGHAGAGGEHPDNPALGAVDPQSGRPRRKRRRRAAA